MTDSTIQPEETLSFKEQYENAIDKSDHVPQSKIIGEFVLDAFINSSGESQKIRELREQIKTAIGNADDDTAHELMVELKTIKDAEQENAAALAEISSRFSISQILSSFRQDPAFQEIVYGLAFKVLTHSHQALTTPIGKTKTSRPKAEPKPPVTHTITKGDESVVVTMTRGPQKPSADKPFYELLGFSIHADESGRETIEPATFLLNDGTESNANKREIIAALNNHTAFEGVTITTNS